MTADKTAAPDLGTPITMTYRNYRGEVDQRTVVPSRIWFGSTDWHPEPGWLMSAYDLAKAAHRDFALADCQFADLCASGQQVRALELRLKDWQGRAEMAGRALEAVLNGKPVRNADEIISFCKNAALTPAPQPEAEHCGCGDKACFACFPAATPTAQDAVFREIIDWCHLQPGNYPNWMDRARQAVGDFEGDPGQPPQPNVSVAEAQIDAIAMALSKRIYKQTEGEWQPSIRQADELARAALRALKGEDE